jgi:hypothetical protein
MTRGFVLVHTLLAAIALPSAAHAEAGWLGVTVDAGVPDGASAAVVVRPVSRLRLHAGATHNAISTGMRGGITLAPLRTWFSPTLSLDVGTYPEGDANPLARKVTGDAMFSSAMFERVGYSYANAHLGFEFGRERATFYIHAGASYITTKIKNLDAASDDSSTMVTFTQDPVVNVWTVSARLGVIVYFL